MFLVSYLGFVYYARNEGESLSSVSRRFLSDEDEQPEAGMATIPVPQTAPNAPTPIETSSEAEGDPPRLQFSPGFIAVLSALFLYVPAGSWCLFAFVVPFVAFIAFARYPGEPTAQTVRRFFKADDQAGVPDDAAPLLDQTVSQPEPEGQPVLTEADLQAEADRFAREAQTGSAGGMGLGDVKLGLAIGALLGPGMALLSLLFATGIGAVTGAVLAGVNRQNNLRIGVPFVPFMAAGAILVMLFGNGFVAWYLRVSGLSEKPQEPVPVVRSYRPDRPTRDNPFARPPLVPGPTQQGTGNRE
jgi:prepilin signal peptidase PulO-like enzyme (type II secretory pathway)